LGEHRCVRRVDSDRARPQPLAVGTWKLDTQKPDFGGMPALKDLKVMVTEDSKTKVSWKANGIDAQGKKVSESYSGGLGGKASRVKGSEMGESIAYMRNP